MALSFGAELRARRLAAGMSLSELAKLVNYSKSHLSKIENGTKVPGVMLARLCDAALDADGVLAALAPDQLSFSPVPAARRATAAGRWTIRLEPDGRGALSDTLGGHAGWEFRELMSWPATADRSNSRISEIVELSRQQFDQLRRMSQSLSSATMIPLLVAQTHAMRVSAGSTDYPNPALLVMASRFAELTGWMCQEAGDDGGATWWTDLAVTFAEAGGDTRLSAYALVRRADMAMYRRSGMTTVELARRVQRIDCGARIRALAAQREAQGQAIVGDESSCFEALDRASRWFGQADDRVAEPVLGSSTVSDPVRMAAGWCFYDLGRPERAVESLTRQFGDLPPWAARTRARLGGRLALALLATGDVTHGCTVLAQAIDDCSGLGSATVRADFRTAVPYLNRYAGNSAARRVMPHLIDALV
ncbi:helix-turn-helix transcriptional regulator [Actinoplanes sp. Pm04-4]|uniref:Helix-turn-helix transcriptional regulator n=1 Tax=Paractinoplanes pyxinae TaxID=2997416 RepID=A0ABT4B7F8_9ACTN|nr:helix-turn-helix transcriptional regulator [Actinoplanes pyxinae]MCY1142439.1 helix-turn-helix transcriptional regulator [Actinoplanes pyxinae]